MHPGAILLAEDEVLIRLDMVDQLRQAGFRVFAVANGDEAMKVLQKLGSDFALVITDVRMPGRTDGAALAAWIRHERPGIKVMLISAHPLSQVSAHADAS